jgi:hypothetical protein
MDTEQAKMTKPLIQIDDEVREMTDDEYAQYQEMISSVPTLGEVE